MDSKTAIKLLLAVGVLMLLSGIIFLFIKQLIPSALTIAGAFCCFLAALNLKSKSGR